MHVYLIPGFAGTELLTNQTPNLLVDPLLWVAESRIAYGQIGYVDIDAAASGPGPLCPAGIVMRSRDPLPDFYGSLTDQIVKAGHTLHVAGWDWRFGLAAAAAAVRAFIRHESGADRIAIVAHSTGGLVARLVAKLLDGEGNLALIDRIIHVATPHYGTFYPLACVTRQAATIQRLQNPLASLFYPGGGPVPTDTIQQLLARFVSFWEILPFRNYGYYHDLKFDEIARLYSTLYYERFNAHMLSARLNTALDTQEALQTAVYPDIEAAVYGRGKWTPAGVQDGTDHSRLLATAYASTGDETVEEGSAVRPDIHTRITSPRWSHDSIVQDGSAIESILSLIPA